ncbi:MAG: hypothetical protein H8F28_20765 [Fibrella sp.]|nr:hypothetical protein [Armatimonadota bacterium]
MANRDEMTEATDAQASVPGSAAEALKKHEAAKMSRRAVLSKVGLQFGAAALLALSADDLAKKVTATIAARNKDSQVAQAVAQEFKNAGMAFADDVDASGTPNPCVTNENGPGNCEACLSQRYNACLSKTPVLQWEKCRTALTACSIICINGSPSEAARCFTAATQ